MDPRYHFQGLRDTKKKNKGQILCRNLKGGTANSRFIPAHGVEHTEDVLGSEVGLVAHLLAGMNVVPYNQIIRNVTHRQTMVPRLRHTHVIVAVIVLE